MNNESAITRLAEAAMEERHYDSIEEMLADIFCDDVYLGVAGILFEKLSRDHCLVCGESLTADRECPYGCTEADDYGFLEGFHFGVDD